MADQGIVTSGNEEDKEDKMETKDQSVPKLKKQKAPAQLERERVRRRRRRQRKKMMQGLSGGVKTVLPKAGGPAEAFPEAVQAFPGSVRSVSEPEQQPPPVFEAAKPAVLEATPEQSVPQLPEDVTILQNNEEQVSLPEDIGSGANFFEQALPEEVEVHKQEAEEKLEKKIFEPQRREETSGKAPKKLEKDQLGEAKSTLLGALRSIFRPRVLMTIVALVGLIYFVYWGYSSKFYDKVAGSVTDFFPQKTFTKIGITVNENGLSDFGIISALLFGDNRGAAADLVPQPIMVATYFGELREPAVKGETGISAATFYGELKDEAADFNQFVEYMSNLEQSQSLYQIDVYEMLDRTQQRDVALLQYLDDLAIAREEGLKVRQKIGLNIDDLKISLESLNPDRAQYEADFFVAMEQLQAEKSDLLLKGFVDISQKQTALRARINALNKLATYYDAALARLNKRIEAVDKNREALIEGIRVVDIPGGGLDIIIRPF